MLNPDARIARARLAAHRRWNGDDIAELDRLTREFHAAMEASNIDEAIDDLVDAAPVMTAAQLARLRRLATAEPLPERDEAVAS
jgi:hypothetical protein